MDRLMERVEKKFGVYGEIFVTLVLYVACATSVALAMIFAPYLLLILPAIAAWMVWSVWNE